MKQEIIDKIYKKNKINVNYSPIRWDIALVNEMLSDAIDEALKQMINEFMWSDELVREYVSFYIKNQGHPDKIEYLGKDLIDIFKKTKQS